MRLLLTTDPIGGVWMFTQELARELLRRGHAVALVSLGRLPSAEQMSWVRNARVLYGRSFRFVACASPLEWMQGNERAYSDAERLLLRVAEEFAPEVFHSNQFCFGALPLRIPKMVTAHSDVLSWARVCRPGGLEASPWLARYLQMVQRGLDGADAVTAPTVWMLAALQREFRVDAATCVVPNGRSLPSLISPGRKLQVVSAGRLWDEAKNLAMLTRMKSPMPVLIAGEQSQAAAESGGEDSAAEEAGSEAAFVSPQGAPAEAGAFQTVGPLDEHALLKLFRESSVYLAASTYEPFGLAPLEAALCGCAVVANRIPSLVEVWGDAALYFADAAEVTRQLAHLAESPAYLAQAQARANLRARQFTAARMADGYETLYAKALPGQARKQKRSSLAGRQKGAEQELASYAG